MLRRSKPSRIADRCWNAVPADPRVPGVPHVPRVPAFFCPDVRSLSGAPTGQGKLLIQIVLHCQNRLVRRILKKDFGEKRSGCCPTVFFSAKIISECCQRAKIVEITT